MGALDYLRDELRQLQEQGLLLHPRTLEGPTILPVATLTEPFYPAVAREVELGHTEETKRLIGGGTRASLLWIIPSGVLAMTTIWFIVPVVYGQEFGRAAVAFALIWPGAAFAQALFWSRPTLLAFAFASGKDPYPLSASPVVRHIKICATRTPGYSATGTPP